MLDPGPSVRRNAIYSGLLMVGSPLRDDNPDREQFRRRIDGYAPVSWGVSNGVGGIDPIVHDQWRIEHSLYTQR